MANNKFQALGLSDESDNDDEQTGSQFKKQPSPSSGSAAQPSLPAPQPVPSSHHRLQSTYCVWFSRRPKNAAHGDFNQNLRQVGQFSSCEQFWQLYAHLLRPADMPQSSDFHIFKEGIKPMWEHEANRFGGKWSVRLRKGLANRCWENLVLAMLGEQFMVGEEVCGAVVSVRYQEDILSIWNRTANDTGVTNRIRDTFRRVLNLPPGIITEYKTHNDAIKDQASFRGSEGFAR